MMYIDEAVPSSLEKDGGGGQEEQDEDEKDEDEEGVSCNVVSIACSRDAPAGTDGIKGAKANGSAISLTCAEAGPCRVLEAGA
jgi:hypothetical protein